jgi:predicted ArsR family transcriptional regulator
MALDPTRGTPAGLDETRLHRALGDRSRVRILELVRGADHAVDAAWLAEHVGLHPNTVRSHLHILEEAQLLTSRPEERTSPGRPRLVYTATPEGISREERAGYRLLAEILASYLANSAKDSSEQAEEAGRAWGRYLVERRPRDASGSTEEDVAAVVGLLDRFGFEPSVESDASGHTVLMQHCPFGEVADHYRKIVCSVHLGLMQGALVELGAHVEADRLDPLVRPGVCSAHLGAVAS